MPNSNMSRLSVVGEPKTQMASYMAREAAQRELRQRVASGQLDPNDLNGIKREFKDIYNQEYYKNYAELIRLDQPVHKIVYLPTQHPAGTKFYVKHAAASFTKINCFIHVHKGCITVGRVNLPLDDDIFMETKEAFLGVWPGPLDKSDDSVKRKTNDYIDTLWQHDSERRIRYTDSASDDQRKIILKLLTELLHRNGSIDAPGITRLLLKSDQTEIQKDEASKRPLETLQKYLLLGKRSEAIKFSKSRKLWDHAQCLSYLDKYQPQNKRDYIKDGPRLRDDSIVQLNDEYISSLDQAILKTVYRSLLNRILQKDPDSVNVVEHPKVGNDAYQFAILSANDCEMEFDQSNEVFKLINAMKRSSDNPSMSNSHIISLGLTTLDTGDIAEDSSYRSMLLFRQTDTYASRTLTISNIDTLILNEIWEYCLNLANNTTDPASYHYIFDLIPFKLVFASRLLDFGLHRMFAQYLISIKNSLTKIKQSHIKKDDFYDWNTIERSVEYLSQVWEVFRSSPDALTEDVQKLESLLNPPPMKSPGLPPAFDTSVQTQTAAHSSGQPYEVRADSSSQDYPSLPYQGESVYDPSQNLPQIRQPHFSYSVPSGFNQPPPQATILEEPINDFNPEPDHSDMESSQINYESRSRQQRHQHQQPPHMQNQPSSRNQHPQHYDAYNDYSNEPSRRTSLDGQPYGSQSYNALNSAAPDRAAKTMTSSSPVNNNNNNNSYNRDSLPPNPGMVDSFNAFSPISQYDDIPRQENDYKTQTIQQQPAHSSQTHQHPPQQERASFSSTGNNVYGNSNNHSQTTSSSMAGETSRSGTTKITDSQQQAKIDEAQGAGLLANLAGSVRAFLPKSNSKQMILPDDSNPAIVFDKERNTWIDTSKPDGGTNDDFNEPPPVSAPVRPPASYSFAPKSAKTRYPKSQFQP